MTDATPLPFDGEPGVVRKKGPVTLRLSVVMGLRAGLKSVRGMRRSLTEDEQHKVASAIVGHLKARIGRSRRDRLPRGMGINPAAIGRCRRGRDRPPAGGSSTRLDLHSLEPHVNRRAPYRSAFKRACATAAWPDAVQ
jgi:hypothetical protein